MLGILPTIGLLGPSMGDDAFSTLGFGLLAGFTGQLLGRPEQLTSPGFNNDMQAPGFNQIGDLDAFERAARQAGMSGYLGSNTVFGGDPANGGYSQGPYSQMTYGNQGASFGAQANSFVGWTGGRNQVTSGAIAGNFNQYQGTYAQNYEQPSFGYPCNCQYGGFPPPPMPFPSAGSYFQPASCAHSYYMQQQQQSFSYGGPSYPTHPSPSPYGGSSYGASSGQGSAGSPVPSRAVFQKCPQVAEGQWGDGAAVISGRLVGSPQGQNAITVGGGDPRSNSDGMANVRNSVWTVMQNDDSLSYDVDRGKFFRSYSDGSRKDVLDISQVSSSIAQAQGNPAVANNQITAMLNQVPSDETLFGAAQQRPVPGPVPNFGAAPTGAGFGFAGETGGVSDLFSGSVGIANAAAANNSSFVNNLPPITSPTVPTQNPALAQQQLNALESNSDNLDISQFLEQALGIRQLLPSAQVQAVGTPGVKAPFSVVAHSYFNQDTQQTVPVDQVQIHEKGNFTNRTTEFNVGQNIEFTATKTNAEVGKYYQVAVSWKDGAQKVWDYRADNNNGTRVDIWSPVA